MADKRGRPTGFRLSPLSRMAISCAKTGQKHKQSTKDKISKSLIIYFRNLHPLSEEISRKYCNIKNSDLYYWITDNKEDLDCIDDIMTDRSIKNSNKIELAYGQFIEFFSHNLTPEQLMLLKEECIANGIDHSILDVCI